MINKAYPWAKHNNLLIDNEPDNNDSSVVHNPENAVGLFDSYCKDLSLTLQENSDNDILSEESSNREEFKKKYLLVRAVVVDNASVDEVTIRTIDP